MAQIEGKHANGQGLGKYIGERRLKLLMTGVSVAAILIGAGPAPAQPSGPPVQTATNEAPIVFDIPAQPLESAVTAFGFQSGYQVAVDQATLAGLKSNEVRGSFTPEEALSRLLAGTGVTYRLIDENSVTLTATSPGSTDDGTIVLNPITVEGTATGHQYEIDEGFNAEFQSTATKTPLPLRQTPQAVSVVTRDSIDARFARDQATALEQAAGVTVSGGAGPFAGRPGRFNQRILLRGVALTGGNNADLRDDGFAVPADRFTPDLAIYERIEAVKGPSSVLYGQGEAGGFINRVRKKPTAEPRYGASLATGSYGLVRGEVDAAGPIFTADRVRGRFVAAAERGDSFVDEVESNVVVVAPSLEIDLTDDTRVLGQVTYQRDRHVPNPGTGLVLRDDEFVPPNTPISQYNAVAPDLDDNGNDVFFASTQLDHNITDDWLATLRLNYNRVDSRSFEDRYAFGIYAGGNTYIYSTVDNSVTDTFAGELRLDGKLSVLGREHQLLVGVDAERRTEDRQFSYNGLGVGNIYAANFSSFPALSQADILGPGGSDQDTFFERNEFGAYGQVILNPVDRLKFILGGRYDIFEQSNEDNQTGANLSELSDSAFTGRFGAVYDLTDQVTVYGTVAQSFTPTTATDVNSQILDPIEGLLYELGAKAEFFDARLGVTLSAFRLDRTNVPIPDPNNTRFSVSSGVQRNDGLELEVNGEPLPGWNLSFAGTLLDAEFTERDDPNFGNRPRFSAPWQVSLFSTYELQSGPLKGLGFGGGIFAIGDRTVLDNNDATVDGHERVDLTAFYNGLENAELSIYVRNVLDAEYIERPLFSSRLSQYGAPRSFVVRGRVKF